MRSAMTEAGIGLLVIVAGAIFVAGAFYESEEQEAEGYRISITVSDAAGLTEGSNVRLAGEDVGEVSALWQRPRGAKAALAFAHGAGAGMQHVFLEAACAGLV